MDSEIKRLLEETRALAKDNHRMLRAIRRDQWFGFIAKIIIWAIVLALPIYIYRQYLEPIVSSFSTTTDTTKTDVFELPTSADIQNLINSFKKK